MVECVFVTKIVDVLEGQVEVEGHLLSMSSGDPCENGRKAMASSNRLINFLKVAMMD